MLKIWEKSVTCIRKLTVFHFDRITLKIIRCIFFFLLNSSSHISLGKMGIIPIFPNSYISCITGTASWNHVLVIVVVIVDPPGPPDPLTHWAPLTLDPENPPSRGQDSPHVCVCLWTPPPSDPRNPGPAPWAQNSTDPEPPKTESGPLPNPDALNLDPNARVLCWPGPPHQTPQTQTPHTSPRMVCWVVPVS